jgi:phosphoglycerate dehydrogenase-like enzyme
MMEICFVEAEISELCYLETALGKHDEELRNLALKGKILTAIGTGRVGLHVIHIALAFGMKVRACDLYHPSPVAEILFVRYVMRHELL